MTKGPSSEIETYNRRYIPILFLLFSFANIYLIVQACFCTTSYAFRFDIIWTILITAALALIHAFYTIFLLVAPRFLFKGTVWLKSSPWIITSTSLFALYFFMEARTIEKLFYCIMGFLLQLIQFIVCIMEPETPVSFVFKPFEKEMLPNLLGNINLSDPNAELNTLFGPPVRVSSNVPGQRSAIVRYGSQAVKSHTRVQVQQSANDYSASPPFYSPQTPPSYQTQTEDSYSQINFDSKK